MVRPEGESPEEVERARLAAVEALRRFEEEDRAGKLCPSRSSAERKSGVKHVVWHMGRQAWKVDYPMQNGPGKGGRRTRLVRPEGESPEEVERARLAAVEVLRRFEEKDRAGKLCPSHSSAEHQSGVKHVNWCKSEQAWQVQYPIRNGRGKGGKKTRLVRPENESPEEVERARLAAVEALRRFEEEERAGKLRGSRGSAERQSGVKHVTWHTRHQAWQVRYPMQNGPGICSSKSRLVRPEGESSEEVERARLAAVEVLRRLEEEDRALGPSSPDGPHAGRGREVRPAAPAEEATLAAFRKRYPVDDSAFDLLAEQLVEVQSMVISKFCPPEEGLCDYSALLAKMVRTIAEAARRPRQAATFSTGCFWESQRLFDAVTGVVSTTVGYTGGNTNNTPTYESVQLGDGYSEAIRIEFDPQLITYDALLAHFDRVRVRTPLPVGLASREGARHPATAGQPAAATQHHSAIWYHDEEQKRAAQAHVGEGAPGVHVARMGSWHDAEGYHQRFYQKGCSVQ